MSTIPKEISSMLVVNFGIYQQRWIGFNKAFLMRSSYRKRPKISKKTSSIVVKEVKGKYYFEFGRKAFNIIFNMKTFTQNIFEKWINSIHNNRDLFSTYLRKVSNRKGPKIDKDSLTANKEKERFDKDAFEDKTFAFELTSNNLLTAPRLFDKSTNMDTVDFLVDKNGTAIKIKKSNYQIFRLGGSLLQKIFKQYSDKLNSKQKADLQKFFERELRRNLTKAGVVGLLQLLSEHHFDIKTSILSDEHVAPADNDSMQGDVGTDKVNNEFLNKIIKKSLMATVRALIFKMGFIWWWQ